MKILFGKEREEYYSMRKDFDKAVKDKVKKLSGELKEKMKSTEQMCKGGEHELEIITEYDEAGHKSVHRFCKKCSYMKTDYL